MSNPNLDSILGQLQIELAQKLLARIQSGEATAADMNVARQLLKDNNIQAATPQANPGLAGLRLALPFPESDGSEAAAG